MDEIVKILVVDDDEVDRMAVKRCLSAAGVEMEWQEVTECSSAIAILKAQTFDCIFLDYLLPDGNGLELVQQLRALGITTPIVVLTGQGDERIAVEVMKAGAFDYLPKSRITPENLYQILRQAIRLYRAEQAATVANERLRESEERYRLVLEGANDGIWDWYCSTNEVYCNDRLLEIIGEERNQFNLTPPNLMARMHPDDGSKIRQAITNHLQNGAKCEAEFRILHSSGSYRYCVARGKAQRDRAGCPLRMSGIISDITESKQLQLALEASEVRFRRLADANIIGIIVTAQGRVIEANAAFLSMVGYSAEDLRLGRLQGSVITPNEYEKADKKAATELKAQGVFGPYEKEYIRADGSRVPVLIGGALVQGVEQTAICFVIDLSDRKRSDAKIGKLNRDLVRRVSEMQTLLDVIPIGIAIALDPQCQHIKVNQALAKLLNLPINANVSLSAPLALRPSYKVYSQGRELEAAELPMQQATAKGISIIDSEMDIILAEGKEKIKLVANSVPLFDEQGKARGSVGVFWDITERKRIEEQERFLAEASALLATSLDYKTTLTNLAMAIVSGQADWCTIDVLDQNSTLRPVASTHRDGAKMPQLAQLRSYPVNLRAKVGVSQVIKNGQAQLYSEISPEIKKAMADTEQRQIMESLGFNSLLCVPLKVRGRTVGAISLVRGIGQRLYDSNDLIWAEDLARRAALAVDNARLYQQATDIGENLRRAIIILGEQQQQLRVLQRITNLLNQRLTNLPGLLQVMVAAVCDGIGEAEFAIISLHDPQSQQLELTATAGIERANLHLLSTQANLLHRVFSTGTAQLVQKSKVSPAQSLQEPASIYAVAIESAASGRLGVMLIGNWRNTEAFDVEDRNLLEAVGEQAAIAINNARLINALEEREERLGLQNEILAQQNHELEATHNQIAQQNLQLIEAARLKSQFLATMSHELRTPMNSVIGFAQVLLRQRTATLSSAQADMVERILNNGKNLLALINDILDLSKIEAGRLELKQEEFDLNKLIATTIAELRPLAEQKQLPIVFHRQLSSPIVINDSARVRQILVNLLSNAIKFTDLGNVEISLSETATNEILIGVQDTGVGIAESDLEHIFEEFRQVDQTTTRQYGGTGLGLAIIKSLVDMMQGSITVESTLGQGSTFYVCLPRQIEMQPPITVLK
ncbi:PAS domain S-box protein [Chlorogloea sp. CCALA 695]|uniref:PAS domain S-box protein n=1 Tax=Chlorogloea sp. CCALA 695 TaxID=2107693 RepID=UPI000D0537F4|nr:PAS domain S-box protein [Chlorogloea sp. CCALA 695]PSB33212.1 histidine kinase [Chlorogloea sp. CCALA 695]